MTEYQSLFENYTALVKRVDDHTRQVQALYADHIACQKGCDTCCKPLNLFPVEAFALAAAFKAIPPEGRSRAADVLEADTGQCPLLVEHQCLLYEARPVICRTHGFPIYMETDGSGMVDFCPENFTGIREFPKEALLNLEQLNTLLTAVNQHFLAAIQTDPPLPERISVGEALFLLEI